MWTHKIQIFSRADIAIASKLLYFGNLFGYKWNLAQTIKKCTTFFVVLRTKSKKFCDFHKNPMDPGNGYGYASIHQFLRIRIRIHAFWPNWCYDFKLICIPKWQFFDLEFFSISKTPNFENFENMLIEKQQKMKSGVAKTPEMLGVFPRRICGGQAPLSSWWRTKIGLPPPKVSDS